MRPIRVKLRTFFSPPIIVRGGALFFFLIYLFIYLWLCWVFISVWGLFLVATSGGHSSSRWAGLSLSRPLLLRSTGSRRASSVVVAHGPSCSAACGIFPDQGANPCPLHWQADSQPLCHQGSPCTLFLCGWIVPASHLGKPARWRNWHVEEGRTRKALRPGAELCPKCPWNALLQCKLVLYYLQPKASQALQATYLLFSLGCKDMVSLK